MQYYDKKIVGSRIQQLRKSRNITQYSLAEMLDYTSERQLQRIECGETACSIDKLMEIAQILDVSTDFLLFGKCGSANEMQESLFANMSDGKKQFLIKLLEVAVENIDLV